MSPRRKTKSKSLRERFFAFDDDLAARGVPPLGTWWREGVGRWLDAYEARKVVELWACAGRGSAKSTALYKLALFFALYGDFSIPPGETHFAAVLSRLKEEASKGIVIIDGWCELLGVPHRLSGDVVELVGTGRGVRVVAASVAGTSGWRAFFIGRDERSKWGFAGAETVDADEVDTSAAAMTATHEFAPLVSTGSAWGKAGTFYETVTAGSDERRVVLGPAATWVVAPHITEESTRRKERNERRWRREYLCEFSAVTGDAFEPEDIDRIFGPTWSFGTVDNLRESARWSRPIAIIDPAGGGTTFRVDAYTFCLARWVLPANSVTPIIVVNNICGWTGRELRETTLARVVSYYCGVADGGGARVVVGDQRDASFLANEVPRHHDLRYESIPWTSERKESAVQRLQRWMREGTLVVYDPAHSPMRGELYAFEEKIAPSGALTYAARGTCHDDYASLLLTLAMAADKLDLFPVPWTDGHPHPMPSIAALYRDSAASRDARPFGWPGASGNGTEPLE